MKSLRFKCSNDTVKNIYSLFDSLVSDKNILSKVLKDNEEIIIIKNFEGNCGFAIGKESFNLNNGILDSINAKGKFAGTESYVDISMLKGLSLNNAFFFKEEDIIRCSENYGIVGNRDDYAKSDVIFAPKSPYKFSDIAEVREEYKYLSNGYKKVNLPNSFKSIIENTNYINFFSNEVKNSYTVNRLFEMNGAIFCKNKVVGYKALELLKGVESDFYNELLECVVGIGKPINSVYFYSDLKWSCILYRESKQVKGEYEIVIK